MGKTAGLYLIPIKSYSKNGGWYLKKSNTCCLCHLSEGARSCMDTNHLFNLWRFDMPLNLLKMIGSWLWDRKAYVVFSGRTPKAFYLNKGLLHDSSYSPYLSIVFHCHLINYLGTHWNHLFTDYLSVLIRSPIRKNSASIIQYLEKEGTWICNQIYAYYNKMKTTDKCIENSGTVISHTGKKTCSECHNKRKKITLVREFKYLKFTGTDRLSLKFTVEKCIGTLQRSWGKLSWLKSGRNVSFKVLRQCSFLHTIFYILLGYPFSVFFEKLSNRPYNKNFLYVFD
jgi:hypothetical protein